MAVDPHGAIKNMVVDTCGANIKMVVDNHGVIKRWLLTLMEL